VIRRHRHRFAALVLLVLAAACSRPAPPAGPPKPRVLFVGVDAASWKVIGPMIQRGELPHFARLMREGAYAPRFETIETTFSPVVWTTIATGRRPQDHGVENFTSQLPNGQTIPVTSSIRRARALWEVASQRGVSVGAVGWWASWPAEKVNGYVITDHANPAFSSFLFADKRYWSADRSTLSQLQRDFYPRDIAPVLARHWLSHESFPYGELQRRGGFTGEQMKVMRATPWDERSPYSLLKIFYSVDEPLVEATRDLMRERPTDLVMLYLRGPDPISHYAWDLVEPEKYAVPAEHLARDKGIVQSVYRYVDGFLGELMGDVSDRTWVIVASDHGFEPAAGSTTNPRTAPRPGEHTTAAKGVLFLHGPHVLAGKELQGPSPYDLAPTLCWLLGLPISREMPGHPLTEAFDPGFARSQRALYVPTYGPRPTQPMMASGSDQKMLESLRALGYIQ
jgi:arylsulfatase A-like enzyme